MKYPLDFWKIKLHDNMLRKNFYKLKLFKDELYDLEDITYMFNKKQINTINKYARDLPQNMYIAGGSLISILRGNKINDIDIFTVGSEDECQRSLITFSSRLFPMGEYEIYHYTPVIKFSKNAVTFRQDNIYQVILRSYRSPSEIVHGFDLDSCGIIFVNNNINFLDPERASPSYIYRL